jgi:hypothetical protein
VCHADFKLHVFEAHSGMPIIGSDHSLTPLHPLTQMLCNFGLDVLEALSGTCTLWVVGRKGTIPLIADALVAFMIVLLHAIVLMCQVCVYV